MNTPRPEIVDPSDDPLEVAIAKEREESGLITKEIQVGTHRIVYNEGGEGEAILMLHGFACNKDYWTWMARHMVRSYHVIAPDLPGFGESSKIDDESYDDVSQSVRVRAFADALGLTTMHVIGNSMGASIGGKFAVDNPHRTTSLALVDGGAWSAAESDLGKAVRLGEKHPLVVESPEDVTRAMSFAYVVPPNIPDPVKGYMARLTTRNAPFSMKVGTDQGKKPYSLESELSQISAKTLILWGDQDRIVHVANARLLKDGIPDARVVIMENCGHAPQMERPEETAQHYLSFLRSL